MMATRAADADSDYGRRSRFGGLAEAFTIMFGGDFLALPVHAGGLAVVDLHAIHADVALPCRRARVAGDDAGQGDEAAAILGPALQDGKIEDAEIFAQDDFFAGRVFGGHQSWGRIFPCRQAWGACELCRGSLPGSGDS